ncbi:hypothetical protein BU17DRAFT_72172 [Hysterangium stoloniferum]|nr:hypothetical protein BU17DRAFT_72172 [Hysterangium stoloniferum]
MAHGQPQKCIRNIAGLQNQAAQSSIPQLPNGKTLTDDLELSLLPDGPHGIINSSLLVWPEQGLGLYTDSTRFLIDNDDASMGSDAEVEEASVCRDWEEEDLQESMVKLALHEGDNLTDEDLAPLSAKEKHREAQKVNHNQTTMDSFISSAASMQRLPQGGAGFGINPKLVVDYQHSVEVEIPTEHATCDESIKTQIPPMMNEGTIGVVVPSEIEEENMEITSLPTNQEDETGWEDDLDECIQGCGVKIRSWDVLGDTLPINQVNQLLILCNFATLRLKGYGKIDASLHIAQQWHEGFQTIAYRETWWSEDVRKLIA